MSQLLFILVSIFIFIISAAITMCSKSTASFTGRFMQHGMSGLLEKTRAYFVFIAFTLQVLACITAANNFLHISNHVIVSLDILCFSTLLILSKYHVFKEAPRYHFVEI